uniref:Zinc finger protein 27 n=1 Tax=Cacopsylla melanoneura TaxID=428564 RepID=A0A8D8XIA8_9HEMI
MSGKNGFSFSFLPHRQKKKKSFPFSCFRLYPLKEERILESTEMRPVDEDQHILLPEKDLGRLHKYLSCHQCGEKYKHKRTLQTHILKHSNTKTKTKVLKQAKKYKCRLCPKAFIHLSHLNDHQYVHTGKKSHLCHLCSASFTSKRGLDGHIKVLHEGVERARDFSQCELCGKSFIHRHHYHRHKKNIHGDGKPTCDICGKILGSKDNLVSHMNTHTGNAPYECLICCIHFKHRASQTAHYKRNHPGVIPPKTQSLDTTRFEKLEESKTNEIKNDIMETSYVCDLCSESFTCKGFLLQHKRNTHPNRKRMCELCGKSFNKPQSYYVHIKNIHGNAKPACPICGKIVSSKVFLAVHMNMHTGDKPFCCGICEKPFGSKRYLQNHVLTHTGEKPFQCLICLKLLKQKYSLKLHYKRKHPGETISELNLSS